MNRLTNSIYRSEPSHRTKKLPFATTNYTSTTLLTFTTMSVAQWSAILPKNHWDLVPEQIIQVLTEDFWSGPLHSPQSMGPTSPWACPPITLIEEVPVPPWGAEGGIMPQPRACIWPPHPRSTHYPQLTKTQRYKRFLFWYFSEMFLWNFWELGNNLQLKNRIMMW